MTTRNSWRSAPYYLLLLPAFFAGHGYLQYTGLVTPGAALGIFAKYLVVAVLLWAISRLFLRDWRAAGIVAFALLCLQFFFGSLQDGLRHTGSGELSRYAVLLPFCLLCLGGLILTLRKRGLSPRLPVFLNLVLAVLLLIDTGTIVTRSKKADPLPEGGEQWTGVTPRDSLRDIYVIVADEYAGLRQLRTQFGFDNRSFTDSLRARGFRVLEEPHSNYNLTEYSTASLLNMSYLPVAGRTQPRDVARCLAWIADNRTEALLSGAGYSVQHLSPFGSRHAAATVPDVFHLHSPELIEGQTLSFRLWKDLGYHLYERGWLKAHPQAYLNKSVNKLLLERANALVDTPMTRPRFVYAHFLLPHNPFYYDSAGRPNPYPVLRDFADQKAYLGYLQYANGVYLQLIDRIKKQSRRAPVILFLSDHGFRGAPVKDSSLLFSNFAAIAAPGLNLSGWKKNTSNVNQMRLLLNAAAGQRLPLLPDSTRYIKGENEP